MNRLSVNENALIPRLSYNIIVMIVMLSIYTLLFKFVRYELNFIFIISSILVLLISQFNKIRQKNIFTLSKFYFSLIELIQILINYLLMFPYRIFRLSVYCSIGSIFYLLFDFNNKWFVGFSISKIKLDTGNTIALSIVAIFIPFLFTALNYAKSRLSLLLPSRVVDKCFGKDFVKASVFLGSIYLIAAISPFLNIQQSKESIFQIALVVISFFTSATFIWGTLRLSEKEHSLRYYRFIESKNLKKAFIDDVPHLKIPDMHLYRIIRIYILGIVELKSYNIFSQLKPNKECVNMAKTVVDSFVIILNKSVKDIEPVEDFSVAVEELGKYVADYYYCRKYYTYQFDEEVNIFLTEELKKIIKKCSSPENEKYLNSFIDPIRMMIFAASETNHNNQSGYYTNPILTPWNDFLKQTFDMTYTLESTVYAARIIQIVGDLTCSEIRKYNYNDTNIDIITYFGLIHCKSKIFWHSQRIQLVFEQLNKILYSYIEYWIENPFDKDRFIKEVWFTSYSKILDSFFINVKNKDISYSNPLDALSNTLNSESLICIYARIIFKLNNENTISIIKSKMPEHAPKAGEYRNWLRKENLHVIHNLLFKTLRADNYKVLVHKQQQLEVIVSLYYIDLIFVKKTEELEFYQKWLKSSINYYNLFIQEVSNILQNNSEVFHNEMFDTLLAIPALSLTYTNPDNHELTDEIVKSFTEMLIFNFNNTKNDEFGHIKSSIRSVILILSGWLYVTERLPDLKIEMENILKQNPYVVKHRLFVTEHESYGLHSFTSHRDMIWYLFASTLWQGTNVQNTVYQTVMRKDKLIEYAKQFTVESTEKEDEYNWD